MRAPQVLVYMNLMGCLRGGGAKPSVITSKSLAEAEVLCSRFASIIVASHSADSHKDKDKIKPDDAASTNRWDLLVEESVPRRLGEVARMHRKVLTAKGEDAVTAGVVPAVQMLGMLLFAAAGSAKDGKMRGFLKDQAGRTLEFYGRAPVTRRNLASALDALQNVYSRDAGFAAAATRE